MTALKEGDEVAGSFVEREIGLVIGDWGAEDPLQRVACGWHATHSRVRVCASRRRPCSLSLGRARPSFSTVLPVVFLKYGVGTKLKILNNNPVVFSSATSRPLQ